MTRRAIEIESLAAFDAAVAEIHTRTHRRLDGWFIQSVDLTGREHVLAGLDPRGAVFLGCPLSLAAQHELQRRGALLFPRLPDLPFDPYRAGLYGADELYATAERDRAEGDPHPSVDAAIYAWSQAGGPTQGLAHSLAATLHDHAISDALDEALADTDPHDLVGVMGGHALLRGDDAYRQAVSLGSALTRAGKTVLTGGGPGAMEATNLGAYLSPWPGAEDEAVAMLVAARSYRRIGEEPGSLERWVAAGMAVRSRWPAADAGRSVGIPTWFYGHEPSNVFATQIAKYFANALREDTLLHRCRGGVVVLPGQAGTVQEIFQAATENFYAAAPSDVSPMVLVGRDYWTREYPAWPVLERLGRDRTMGSSLWCVDSVDEACAILSNAPRP